MIPLSSHEEITSGGLSNECFDRMWVKACHAARAQPIQLQGWMTIDLVCYTAPHGWRKREPMSRESKRYSQPVQSWYNPNQRDVINALPFQAAPTVVDTLLSHYRQEFTGRCPVTLHAGQAHRIGAPVGRGITQPAATQQKCATCKLFEREDAANSTDHWL